MSTDHAVVVIGCKVDKSQVFMTKDMRVCEHQLQVEGAKFCSECGKRAWKTTTTAIEEFDDRGCETTLSGLLVFDDYSSDFILVAGESINFDDSSKDNAAMLRTNLVDVAKRRVKAALGPLGLWDDDQFGIWLMTWWT